MVFLILSINIILLVIFWVFIMKVIFFWIWFIYVKFLFMRNILNISILILMSFFVN